MKKSREAARQFEQLLEIMACLRSPVGCPWDRSRSKEDIINYFLEEVVDVDVVNDIYEYFREAETDNLEKAMDEMPDYSETEIRLVRIKFFSEMAN